MKTSKLLLLGLTLIVGGCISGAPRLTPDQQLKLAKITVHKTGENPTKEYTVLEGLSAADCSGAPGGGRVWGNSERAIETLRRKAAAVNADAVVDVSCSPVPLLNNCFAAQRCSGEAVRFK